MPTKKNSGRRYLAKGSADRGTNLSPAREEDIKERRAHISAICRVEPVTRREIREATGIALSTIEDDLKKMIDAGNLRSRLHKFENLYWVPA